MRSFLRGLAKTCVAGAMAGSLVVFVGHTAEAAPTTHQVRVDSRAQRVAAELRAGNSVTVTGTDGMFVAKRIGDSVAVDHVSAGPMPMATGTQTCAKAFAVTTVVFAVGSAALLTVIAAAAVIGAATIAIGGAVVPVAALSAAAAAMASWSGVAALIAKSVC